jgi:pyruvate dehydrogenase E2 component (dihydrolipoamide acetyltransferase)
VARLLRMPDVASDDDEGVLASWLVGERDAFDAAQTIAYVETNTLLLSVEAGRPGVLLRTLVAPGTQVDAGTPIGVIGDLDEQNVDLETLLTELGVQADLVPGPATEPERDDVPEAAQKMAVSLSESASAPELPRHVSDPRPSFFTPELAIPVFDPGPAVLALSVPEPETDPDPEPEPAPQPEPEPQPDPEPDPEPEPEPEPQPELAAPGVRRSGLTHDHLRSTIRAERLVAICAEMGGAETGASVDLLVLKAVGAVHRQLPDMNLTIGPHGVRRESTVDVALIVGTEDGFVAPVVRNVGSLTLESLLTRAHDLVTRARTERLTPAETTGASIMVTNLGKYGIDESVGIVSPPQVAVLALGGVRDDAVVEAGTVVAGKVLTLTLSVDHTLVDDSLAARWLGVLAALLERPEWMQG